MAAVHLNALGCCLRCGEHLRCVPLKAFAVCSYCRQESYRDERATHECHAIMPAHRYPDDGHNPMWKVRLWHRQGDELYCDGARVATIPGLTPFMVRALNDGETRRTPCRACQGLPRFPDGALVTRGSRKGTRVTLCPFCEGTGDEPRRWRAPA